jgi:hypothetical protein
MLAAIDRPLASQCQPEWLPEDGFEVDRSVTAWAMFPNGDLIAGGAFSSVGGVAARNIARWNGWAWAPLGSGMEESFHDADVYALAPLPNGDLIAGGSFYSAGGVAANNIARWNGSTWAPLGSGMNRSFFDNGPVYSLAVLPNGDLVAGGNFVTAGGVPANKIARWSGSIWAPLGSGMGGMNPFVTAMAILPNGDLVAGGRFSSAGDAVVNSIARWNGLNWAAMGSGVDGSGGVTALALLRNGDLVAGGSFQSVGGVAVNNIARWNGSTWSPLGSGMDGQVSTLAVLANGDLVASGYFTTAGEVAVNHIASWNGAAWAPLGPVPGIDATGPLTQVNSGTLFVGGSTIHRWGCAAGLASKTTLGVGCYDQYQSFYEHFTVPPASFDLSNTTIRMSMTASGYSVSTVAGTPSFFTPISDDLGLTDDSVTPVITLPFNIRYPGGTTNQVVVGSNGYVLLQDDTDQRPFYGNVPGLLGGSPRFAPMWGDMDPATGTGSGTVHVDVDTASQTVFVTWLDIQEWNAPTATSTFQVAMSASGTVEYRYLACAMSAASVLTGWSPGLGARDPASRDLSAAAFTTFPDAVSPSLTADARPILGTTLHLVTSNMPPSAPGVMELGLPVRPFDLRLIGMPGCVQQVLPLSYRTFIASGTTGSASLSIPSSTAFLGTQVGCQSLVVSPGSNRANRTVSNGLSLRLGSP